MTTTVDIGERSDAETLRLYWMPGCSSCLRMKEFVEETGRPFTPINVDEHPEHGAWLRAQGLRVPAACIGERGVVGTDLAAVAGLIGVTYEPRPMLEAAVLRDRYLTVLDVLGACSRAVPDDAFDYRFPDRDRDLFELMCHAASVMRYFLGKYDDEAFDRSYLDLQQVRARERRALGERIDETRHAFETWWDRDGSDDPLDAVVTLTWGSRTLHEALEREVWHTAHHVRQVIYALDEIGVRVPQRLTDADLAGLPLPRRIHA